MSNLFKPPATSAAPAPGTDFATRWDAIGNRVGAAPRDFPEAKARYGGLPDGPRPAGSPAAENDTGTFDPNTLGHIPDPKSRLTGLTRNPKAPARTPYGIAPRADSLVPPTSNDPRDFVAPRDNPDVDQEPLDFIQKRNGYLPVTLRNNNPGAISNSTKRGGYRGDDRPAAEGGWYTRFNTPEQGIYAQSELLRDYGRMGLNSPAAIVGKWAVSSNTQYAEFVAAQLGIGPHTQLDLEDPHVRAQFLRAAGRWEAGLTSKDTSAPYKDDVYRRGVAGIFRKHVR